MSYIRYTEPEVQRILGGFTEAGSLGPVIPAAVTANVSLRLAPRQDAAGLLIPVKKRVAELAPPG